jgi:LPS-assembly protein
MPLAGGVYQRAHVGAALLQDNPPVATGPTLRSERFDAYYSLNRPVAPREWLTLNPTAGARVTHYNRALGGRDDYTRTLGELGLDAELRASATYDYRNPRWNIDGLRHLVTPRLSYRYIPEADRGQRYIPAIDRTVFDTHLQPLGLLNRRNLDELTATNTLRLALDNRVQTRDPTYGSRDLFEHKLAADLRFERADGIRTLSAVHNELVLTPAPWFGFEMYHRLDPHTGRTREFNTGLLLRDSDLWALRLANHYLEDEVRENIQEYVADFRYQFTERYGGYFRLHYDMRRHRFIEQSYGLRQTLENRWIVSYQLSFYEGPRRESAFGFSLSFDPIRF